MIRKVLLLLLAVIQTNSFSHCKTKCCDFDELINKTNDTYVCIKNENLRLQIISEDTNFIQRSQDGYCVDMKNDFYLFKIENGTFSKEKLLSVHHVPKCCPLQYYYNPLSHSCDQYNTIITTGFFDQIFVIVGLPECEVIVDIKLKSTEIMVRQKNNVFLPDRNETFLEGTFCIDQTANEDVYIRICERNYHICDDIRCIHKCCADGQSFINGSTCVDTYVHGLTLNFSERILHAQESFAIIHGHRCTLYPLFETKYDYHLDNKGVFHMYEHIKNGTISYKIDEESYCLEHVDKGDLYGYTFFRCLPPTYIEMKFVFTRWAMLISCVFLTLTISIYFISGEIRSLFGKILVSYCSSMLTGFALLSYLSFDLFTGDLVCTLVGFLAFYFIFSSFTWLNVMCIDIHWTFGSSKSFKNTYWKQEKKRRFLLYCIYAWGVPFLLTLLPFVFYLTGISPEYLQKYIYSYNCILQKGRGQYADIVFNTLPLSILEVSNVVLFIKATRHCLKVKSEISRLDDCKSLYYEKSNVLRKHKDRFSLIIKLFFIMGISFLFEVVSSLYNFRKNTVTIYIELVWDTFNSLQGVFIFIIFVCKKKIFMVTRNKFRLGTLKKNPSITSITTARMK